MRDATARQGKARQGKARQGKARQGSCDRMPRMPTPASAPLLTNTGGAPCSAGCNLGTYTVQFRAHDAASLEDAWAVIPF
jgi:hypothetical protein